MSEGARIVQVVRFTPSELIRCQAPDCEQLASAYLEVDGDEYFLCEQTLKRFAVKLPDPKEGHA